MSVGTVEYGTTMFTQHRVPFPLDWLRWGGPPPPPDTPERRGWMLAGYHEGVARARAGETVSWLASSHPAVRVSRLVERREAPAFEAEARRRVLEIRERAPV